MDKTSISLLLALIGLTVIVYYFFAFKSLLTRGEVSQDYWYCSVFMEDKENDFNFPHHSGRKPFIPLSDHLCGDRELELARKFGWEH